MNYCDTCGHQYSDVCGGCETLDGVPVKYSEKKKTNADRIRSMSDEEMAEIILGLVIFHLKTLRSEYHSKGEILDSLNKWLKKEAE